LAGSSSFLTDALSSSFFCSAYIALIKRTLLSSYFFSKRVDLEWLIYLVKGEIAGAT